MASYVIDFNYTDDRGYPANIRSGPHTFDEAKQMRREYEKMAASGTRGTAQIKKIGTDNTSWGIVLTKRIKVSDNWYPNYPDGTIEFTILGRHNKYNSHVRLFAIGMDDFMVEKDIDATYQTRESVKELFNSLKETIFDKVPEVSNKEWFYDQGFVDG